MNDGVFWVIEFTDKTSGFYAFLQFLNILTVTALSTGPLYILLFLLTASASWNFPLNLVRPRSEDSFRVKTNPLLFEQLSTSKISLTETPYYCCELALAMEPYFNLCHADALENLALSFRGLEGKDS